MSKSEAFHGKDSAQPNPCDCAWQQHAQSHQEPRVCRGEKIIRDKQGNIELDERGFWKRVPCDCTAVAPRHFQRRIVGADVVCNCGWYPHSGYEKAGETWDNHEDGGVYV